MTDTEKQRCLNLVNAIEAYSIELERELDKYQSADISREVMMYRKQLGELKGMIKEEKPRVY
jgi:hypothetical protein